MKKLVLTVVVILGLIVSALALSYAIEKTTDTRSTAPRSITIGVRRASQSEASVAQGQIAYEVQMSDGEGNDIGGPVSMVVNVPRTYESSGGRTSGSRPSDALPSTPWGILVPLPENFAQVPPRSLAGQGTGIGVSRSGIAAVVYPGASAKGDTCYGVPIPDTIIGFYGVSCAEFHPSHSGQTYTVDMWELSATNVVGSNSFLASVHLPDSAQVRELAVWAYDGNLWRNLTISLDAIRYDKMGPVCTMAQMESRGSGGMAELSTREIEYPGIDNYEYKYTITVSGFDGTTKHRLLGARIMYEIVINGSPENVQVMHGFEAGSRPWLK
jgi:hypothetical protein